MKVLWKIQIERQWKEAKHRNIISEIKRSYTFVVKFFVSHKTAVSTTTMSEVNPLTLFYLLQIWHFETTEIRDRILDTAVQSMLVDKYVNLWL